MQMILGGEVFIFMTKTKHAKQKQKEKQKLLFYLAALVLDVGIVFLPLCLSLRS